MRIFSFLFLYCFWVAVSVAHSGYTEGKMKTPRTLFSVTLWNPKYLSRLTYTCFTVSCVSFYNLFRILIRQKEYFSSVQFSHPVVSNSLRPHESQNTRLPCPSPIPGVYSNSYPSSWWCHPTMSSSVVPFSSCSLSIPASGSFPMSQLFSWGGQSIGVSTSASVLPMNTQDWSPFGWTGWNSFQSTRLSRGFSNPTVQKHQIFGTQLSSQSNTHLHTWPLEKP